MQRLARPTMACEGLFLRVNVRRCGVMFAVAGVMFVLAICGADPISADVINRDRSSPSVSDTPDVSDVSAIAESVTFDRGVDASLQIPERIVWARDSIAATSDIARTDVLIRSALRTPCPLPMTIVGNGRTGWSAHININIHHNHGRYTLPISTIAINDVVALASHPTRDWLTLDQHQPTARAVMTLAGVRY